jgi:hypothetical protein
MTTRTNRRYDRDFKLGAVGRMEAGENVAAMSRELAVDVCRTDGHPGPRQPGPRRQAPGSSAGHGPPAPTPQTRANPRPRDRISPTFPHSA